MHLQKAVAKGKKITPKMVKEEVNEMKMKACGKALKKKK
jgi:hypothetical protein